MCDNIVQYNKMCYCLEDLCVSVNQYFPNNHDVKTVLLGQRIIFEVQDIPMDANVAEYEEFIDLF